MYSDWSTLKEELLLRWWLRQTELLDWVTIHSDKTAANLDNKDELQLVLLLFI